MDRLSECPECGFEFFESDDDEVMLDWLGDAACYVDGAGWCCRRSTTGRGMRLHEISREQAAELGVRVFPTPREALLNAMRGTA